MPPAIRSIRADASGRYSLISSVGISVLQDFRLQSLSTLCAVFPPDSGVELRTCRTIIVAIPFHQVDDTPDAKAGTECDNESLQYVYCAAEKCHSVFLLLFTLLLFLPLSGPPQRIPPGPILSPQAGASCTARYQTPAAYHYPRAACTSCAL